MGKSFCKFSVNGVYPLREFPRFPAKFRMKSHGFIALLASPSIVDELLVGVSSFANSAILCTQKQRRKFVLTRHRIRARAEGIAREKPPQSEHHESPREDPARNDTIASVPIAYLQGISSQQAIHNSRFETQSATRDGTALNSLSN